MRETGRNGFQSKLVKELESIFPNAIIIRTDPRDTQGIPDILILNYDRWAALEIKGSEFAHRQPNQPWFVERMDDMSYAAFVYPENKDRIVDELQSALQPSW